MNKIITIMSSENQQVDINPIHVSHVVHADKDHSYIYIAGETYITVTVAEGKKFAAQWVAAMNGQK